MRFINRFYDKKVSSKGLGVFRILFSFVFLLEVIRVYRYRQLYFDPLPFIEPNLLSSELAFAIWIATLCMLVLGFYARLAAIVNYIFVLIFISHMGTFEYHMDYTYIGVSFLLMFIPISKSYSLDRLKLKLKLSDHSKNDVPNETTSVLSYWLIVFLGVGLIYFTSVFLKIQSNSWINGLGLWLPASIPQITIIDNQWLLNQEYLMKFLGYFTLIFEFIFLFIFWIKRFRIAVFVIGVILHLGIFVEFPIPYFAMGYIAIYTLLLPNKLWKRLESYFTFFSISNSKWFKIIMEPFISIEPIERIDNRKHSTYLSKPNCITFFIVVVIVLQLLTEFKNPFKVGILKSAYTNINKASSKLLGISQHTVFLDGHYNDYDAIFTLKYKEEFLPLFDEYGMPDDYIAGGIWADFGFRVNRPNVENHMKNLQDGLARYASFYAHTNNIELDNVEFIVLKKSIRASYEWEPDLLLENRMNPWEKVGKMTWIENEYNFEMD